jgi:hypothetical protein
MESLLAPSRFFLDNIYHWKELEQLFAIWSQFSATPRENRGDYLAIVRYFFAREQIRGKSSFFELPVKYTVPPAPARFDDAREYRETSIAFAVPLSSSQHSIYLYWPCIVKIQDHVEYPTPSQVHHRQWDL